MEHREFERRLRDLTGSGLLPGVQGTINKVRRLLAPLQDGAGFLGPQIATVLGELEQSVRSNDVNRADPRVIYAFLRATGKRIRDLLRNPAIQRAGGVPKGLQTSLMGLSDPASHYMLDLATKLQLPENHDLLAPLLQQAGMGPNEQDIDSIVAALEMYFEGEGTA